MATMKPASPGEPAVWTMTVMVESVPPERHLEIGEHLDQLVASAQWRLLAAGLGRVKEWSVHGPAAVEEI